MTNQLLRITLMLLLALATTQHYASAFQLSRRSLPLPPTALCMKSNDDNNAGQLDSAATSRRNLLAAAPFFLSALLLTPTPTMALDMDAFMSQELTPVTSSNSDKKLSDDEALCKFGQPSKQRGDACVRAGLPTTLKKGGVDAYGNVDRGTFARCKQIYVEDPNSPNKGFLMKQNICDSP